MLGYNSLKSAHLLLAEHDHGMRAEWLVEQVAEYWLNLNLGLGVNTLANSATGPDKGSKLQVNCWVQQPVKTHIVSLLVSAECGEVW